MYKKIKLYLEKKGHKVIEIPNKKTFTLEDLELTLITCDGYDSSLIAKFPNNSTYLDTYGWILYQKGDYAKAIKYLLDAEQLLNEQNNEIFQTTWID